MLQVEGETFKLPKASFIDFSPYFRDLCAYSARTGAGSSVRNPITLNRVRLHHFRPFLRAMFPQYVDVSLPLLDLSVC